MDENCRPITEKAPHSLLRRRPKAPALHLTKVSFRNILHLCQIVAHRLESLFSSKQLKESTDAMTCINNSFCIAAKRETSPVGKAHCQTRLSFYNLCQTNQCSSTLCSR